MTPISRNKKRRAVWIAVLLLASVIFFGFATRPKPGSIEYHYDRLLTYRNNFEIWKEPKSKRDYFRVVTVRRFFAGKPTLAQYIDRKEEDQLALVRLGYFERREFDLKTSLAENHFWQRLDDAMKEASIDQSWFLHGDESRPKWIRVTCRRDNMPTVQRIIERLELSPEPAKVR